MSSSSMDLLAGVGNDCSSNVNWVLPSQMVFQKVVVWGLTGESNVGRPKGKPADTGENRQTSQGREE